MPANQIIDLAPGEVFVHRNVANLVIHTDLNILSVIQFAVDVLRVKHIMVVGHYRCGGVTAALKNARHGIVDNWLRHVKDIRDAYQDQLAAFPTEEVRLDRLCELNVIDQVVHVGQTSVVRDAWARNQDLTLHGWIYGLTDGGVHLNSRCWVLIPVDRSSEGSGHD